VGKVKKFVAKRYTQKNSENMYPIKLDSRSTSQEKNGFKNLKTPREKANFVTQDCCD
jgi:hypothetical protein